MAEWKNPTRFKRAIEVKVLMDRLRNTVPGEVVGRDELSDLIDRNVKSGNPGYSSLRKAIRLLREENIHFDSVSDDFRDGELLPGGQKRITFAEAVRLVTNDINRLRAAASTAQSKLEHGDFDELPDEEQTIHNTFLTIQRVVSAVTTPETIEAIQGKVRVGLCPIPSREVMLLIP